MLSDPLSFTEEELLHAATELPALSPGFRSRAIAAGIESRRRQSFGRCALRAGCLLAMTSSFAVWRAPLSMFGHDLIEPGFVAASDAAYVHASPPLPVPGRYGRGDQLRATGVDDWRLVEAEIDSRQEALRCLQVTNE